MEPTRDSAWRDQKIATLRGEYDYSYNVGTGYDTIPQSVFQQGFPDASSDHAQDEIPFGQTNTPLDPQNLYAAHSHVGDDQYSGLHTFSEMERLIDLAPTDPNFPYPLAKRLLTINRANRYQPRAVRTTNSDLEVVQGQPPAIDAGFAKAPLTGPFAPKDPKQGTLSTVPKKPLIVAQRPLRWYHIAGVALGAYYVLG